MENVIITLDIDVENKTIWIGEENGSGTKYDYESQFDLACVIRTYLEDYHNDIFNK